VEDEKIVQSKLDDSSDGSACFSHQGTWRVRFELTPEECARVKRWAELSDEESIIAGKGIAGVAFMFVPTGIGLVKTATHLQSGKVLDFTDYETW